MCPTHVVVATRFYALTRPSQVFLYPKGIGRPGEVADFHHHRHSLIVFYKGDPRGIIGMGRVFDKHTIIAHRTIIQTFSLFIINVPLEIADDTKTSENSCRDEQWD